MRLALIIFMISLATTTVAIAGPLERINREDAVCLRRTYSTEHMATHPQQTVRTIALQLTLQPDQKDNTIYLNIQIEAASQNFDAFMICDRQDTGLRCMVECDGGGAEVIRIGGREHRVQFVNRDFMLAGGCGGGQQQHARWLAPVPGGDDIFELDDIESCEGVGAGQEPGAARSF